MNYFELELSVEQAKREFSQDEWSVSEYEMELINNELDRPIEVTELSELSMDLYHRPSKYADVIRSMRQRSELQSAK
jgi:hypothetical protein